MGHTQATTKAVEAAHRLLALVKVWWQRGAGSELDGLAPGEIERIARDIGLSMSDLERLARRDHDASHLLLDRLVQLGIKPVDLESAGLLRDMQRTCGLCDSKATCKHDLAERPEDSAWIQYCPNSAELSDQAAAASSRQKKSGAH